MFIGQRTRWIDKGKSIARIQLYQEQRTAEVGEVSFDGSLEDSVVRDADLHTQFRSVLGQIKWLQSRTQFQS
eukprot:12919276-Prorocentrum_lima.AAC.1